MAQNRKPEELEQLLAQAELQNTELGATNKALAKQVKELQDAAASNNPTSAYPKEVQLLVQEKMDAGLPQHIAVERAWAQYRFDEKAKNEAPEGAKAKK